MLLPPSEGKAVGGDDPWRARSGAFPELARARRTVIDAYAAAVDGEQAAKVVGASGPLVERARSSAQALRRNRAVGLPAWQRFTGVVWEHLRPADLDVERIAIVSALLGVCAGDDPVPDFRLKLSVSLPQLGRLDRWWRPSLTAALRRWAAGREVWDLLPNEHAAAVDLGVLGEQVVRVRFDGVSGHDAKAVKGAFARHVLRTGSHRRFAYGDWRASRRDDLVVLRTR